MKKLVALILTVILAVGAIFMVGCGNGNNGGDQTANSGSGGSSSTGSDQIQQVTTYPGVRSVRLSMGAMSETASTTTSTGEQTEAYSERTIIATILPTSALQQVDFTMSWQSNGSSEGIDEYLTLTQETDGSPKAVVRCTKDFSAKGAILITATARAGGLSDTLTATFLGVTREMNIELYGFVDDTRVSYEPDYSEERGYYYILPAVVSDYTPGVFGKPDYYSFLGGCNYYLNFIDFYGDQKGTGFVDVSLSSFGSVYLVPKNEVVLSSTGNPIVIRTPLHHLTNVFNSIDKSYDYGNGKLNQGFSFRPGYLYGETELDLASCLPSGGLLLDDGSNFDGRGVKIASDLVDLKNYTVVDYDMAVANSSFDEGIIGSYTGAEIKSLSEQSLKEVYYEMTFTDQDSKLFTSFRFWIELVPRSVDTGSDIIF